MQTITIAGGRDLALFRGLLQSLVANDLSAWRIFIQLDPGPLTDHYFDAAADILGGFEYALTVNSRGQGIQENSFRLLEYVFRHSSSVNINLAEDTLAAADVTHLAQWYFDRHQPEWLCLSLLSMSRPVEVRAHTAYRNLLFSSKEFNSSGFVVRREEWHRYFQNTKTVHGTALSRLDEDFLVGWDWAVCKHLLGPTDLVSIQPVAARVLRIGSQAAAGDGCNRITGARAAFASLRPTTHESYEVVATADLPDAIRAQLPVQDFVHKLLAAISHSEQLLDEQNEALTKFRREASDRANLASYVLSKLLVQYWCALVPADTWRYRIWSRCVRPIVRRMVIRKSAALASPPAAALAPASEPATASTPTPANLTISAGPALASIPSRAVTFPGLPRLVSSQESPLRILILKLDHIGDLLLSVAALLLLREAWPKANFTLVCGPWNVKLASQFGIFDEIHSYNFFSPHSGEGINAGITEFRRLPLREYDLAIDLRHDPETRPLLNFVRARYRAGFVCDPQFPVRLDLAIPNLELISPLEAPRNALHSETRLITLASAIVATFGEHKGCNLQNLVASRSPLRYFDEGPVVALAPGTGNAIKQWGAARFARVARALATEARCRFVLIGGESDKADAAIVAGVLPSDQYVDVVGKLDISDVPLALAAADLFIGNDTGTTHMAALMGIPTVNIFAGLADVNIWCAKGPNVVTLYAPVDCAPCRLGKLQDCSHGHICLTSISEDDVVASALSLLQRSRLQDVRHEIRKVAPREKVTADTGAVRRLDVGWLVADQQ